MENKASQKSIIIISAPSGAGKTTIVKHILQQFPNLSFSISATTRSKRANETNALDYYFLSEEAFQNHLKNNDFIEWEMVYEGKFYGTLKSELDRIWDLKKMPLLEIDVKGAIRLKQEYTHIKTISIFIQIPSIEILKERLLKRASEDIETIEARIKKAQFELQFMNHFDHLVINDNLEKCLQQVSDIIQQYQYFK